MDVDVPLDEVIIEWDKFRGLGVFRTLWSKVMERSFEVIFYSELVTAFCFHMLQFLMVWWKPTDNEIWLFSFVFIQYYVCI